MSYSNLSLTPEDVEFRMKYKTVINAVAQLEAFGEMLVEFTTQAGRDTWRRKFYEYQKITGKTYRAEAGPGYSLVIRRRARLPQGDHGVIRMRPVHEVTDVTEPLQDFGAVSEEMMEQARVAMARVGVTPQDPASILTKSHEELQGEKEELAEEIRAKEKEKMKDFAPDQMTKKEGANDRRPESGGDAADTGSSRGDD